jgi:hypothetical protein
VPLAYSTYSGLLMGMGNGLYRHGGIPHPRTGKDCFSTELSCQYINMI